jgi:hypothetical protein
MSNISDWRRPLEYLRNCWPNVVIPPGTPETDELWQSRLTRSRLATYGEKVSDGDWALVSKEETDELRKLAQAHGSDALDGITRLPYTKHQRESWASVTGRSRKGDDVVLDAISSAKQDSRWTVSLYASGYHDVPQKKDSLERDELATRVPCTLLTTGAAVNGHGTSLHRKIIDWHTPTGRSISADKDLDSLIRSFGEQYQDLFSEYTDGVSRGEPTKLANAEMRRVVVLYKLKDGQETNDTVGKMWLNRMSEWTE